MSHEPGLLPALRRFFQSLAQTPALLWSFLYFFCLLSGYYVLRPVRDAMAASRDAYAIFPTSLIDWAAARGVDMGQTVIPILFTGTFLSMLLVQPIYGAIVSRFPRRVFLPLVYSFFVACLIGFHLLFDSGIAGRGAVFFIWLAVFNLFAVTVFWSFMADVFSSADAKRYYGYIAAGGTLGGFLGPSITRTLAPVVGVPNLLLVSAAFLSLCLVLILLLSPWARRREAEAGERSGEEAMGGTVLAGLRLVWQVPLLRSLAALLFFGVGVGTLLYNEQIIIARTWFETDAARTRYFSNIDLAINSFAIVMQLLVTRVVLVRYGVAPLLIAPAAAILIGFSILMASPLPLLVAVVQVLTRGSEFSLAKPARDSLYTRVDRESRYKAKAFIDTVVYRGGDVFFAWGHKFIAGFGSVAVFGAGVLVSLGMLASALRVVRAQRVLPDPSGLAAEKDNAMH